MKYMALLSLVTLCGCGHLERSSGSGYNNYGDSLRYSEKDSRPRYDKETQRLAYEMGKDPAYLNQNDLMAIKDRQNVRELERSLSSRKEREQYSKILPWLKGDEEKKAFLSIPSIEGRQQWINKQNIWSRTQAPQQEMKELIDTQDIAVGMPQDYVRKSWGDPQNIEVSGNPIYKNERWRYQRQVSTAQGYRQETRLVYFEAGRVVGWETE